MSKAKVKGSNHIYVRNGRIMKRNMSINKFEFRFSWEVGRSENSVKLVGTHKRYHRLSRPHQYLFNRYTRKNEAK
ncbi:MAG TPA: hypothetical protein VI911_11780 [Patescibacteria group bacterium]|nr:hypothetical protein [Patescibacteria group bacterium]